MEKEPYENQLPHPVFYEYHSKHIGSDGNFRMKRMESNPAAVRIENRIGQEMIQVNQHGSQQDQPVFEPVISVV